MSGNWITSRVAPALALVLFISIGCSSHPNSTGQWTITGNDSGTNQQSNNGTPSDNNGNPPANNNSGQNSGTNNPPPESSAAPIISIDNSGAQVLPGASIHFTFSGAPNRSDLSVSIIVDLKSNAIGSVPEQGPQGEGVITVPTDASGDYYLLLNAGNVIYAYTHFNVAGPNQPVGPNTPSGPLIPNDPSGPPQVSVDPMVPTLSLDKDSYAGGETVQATFDGLPQNADQHLFMSCGSPQPIVSINGLRQGTKAIVVPSNAQYGSCQVRAIVAGSVYASASFNVNAPAAAAPSIVVQDYYLAHLNPGGGLGFQYGNIPTGSQKSVVLVCGSVKSQASSIPDSQTFGVGSLLIPGEASGSCQLRVMMGSTQVVQIPITLVVPPAPTKATLSISTQFHSPGGWVSFFYGGMVNNVNLQKMGFFVPGGAAPIRYPWQVGGTSGSGSAQLPADIEPGTYELRLLYNNGTVAKKSFVVSAPPTSIAPGLSITTQPAGLIPGGVVNFRFSGLPNGADPEVASLTCGSPAPKFTLQGDQGHTMLVIPKNASPGNCQLQVTVGTQMVKHVDFQVISTLN